MTSNTQLSAYQKNGWILSDRIFDDDELDTLRNAAEDFYRGGTARTVPSSHAKVANWTPSDGNVQRHNDYIHYQRPDIGALLSKPVIGQIAAALAGTSSIRIFQATLLYKPPSFDEPSNIVPWHFDKYYWSTCSSERMLTAFIPFHDCDVDMGTISFVNGSHLWSEYEPLTTPKTAADLEKLEPLKLTAERNSASAEPQPVRIPAGHMTFHHCRTVHGSSGNASQRPRMSISLHLQDHANTYQDPALAPDCRHGPYKHDFIVGRDARGVPDYSDPDFCPTIWPPSDLQAPMPPQLQT